MERTREQVEAAYDLGKEAVVTLVLSLAGQVSIQASQLTQQVEEIALLRERLGKNSRNSHKPSSSDGLRRWTVSNRERSGRPSGGQKGHPGKTLLQVAKPDFFEQHRPVACGRCQQPLSEVEGTITARRQVFELPAKLYEVTEHQAVAVVCPHCRTCTAGDFPEGVGQAVQYGNRFKGLMVYLQVYQLLPYRRTGDLLNDVFGLRPAGGTFNLAQRACARGVWEVTEAIKIAITRAPVLGVDETGMRVLNKTWWLHTARNEAMTHYAVHGKRGTEAIEAIGILPNFQGTLVHDALAGYFHYGSRHALCTAHLLRELKAIAQHAGQEWAGQLRALLVEIKNGVGVAVGQGAETLETATVADFNKRYQDLIAAGHAANPLPLQKKTRGRLKRTPAGNLCQADGRPCRESAPVHARLRRPIRQQWERARSPHDEGQAEDLRLLPLSAWCRRLLPGQWLHRDAAQTGYPCSRSAHVCL